jgi:hypothetical protein
MRIAVLADIHSNPIALDAVIADIGTMDQTWVLGDIFGYGPFPVPIWSKIADSKEWLFVRGNHDEVLATGKVAVLLNQPTLESNSKNKAALNGNLEKIFNFINSMPLVRSPLPGIYLSHGTINLKYPGDAKSALTLYPEENDNIKLMIQSFENYS